MERMTASTTPSRGRAPETAEQNIGKPAPEADLRGSYFDSNVPGEHRTARAA